MDAATPPGRRGALPGRIERPLGSPDVSTTSAPLGGEGAPDEPEAEPDAPRGDVDLDLVDEPESDDAVPMASDDDADPVVVDEAEGDRDEADDDPDDGDTLVVTEDDLGDELDAELEAEAAELAPLVELPDHPHFGSDPTPTDARLPRVDDEVQVRVRGLGKVPARKVRKVIRRVDPLSVLKLSFAFNVCVFAMFLVAGVLLWSAAIGSGSTDNIESFVVDIGFEDFKLVGADLFRGFVVFGGGLVIAGTVFAVLLALLFNLISDVLGGIRLTVIEPLLPADDDPEGADAE